MSIYVAPRPTAAVKAGPVGPGAGVLMTEWLLPTVLPNEPQRKMVQAWKLGTACPWVVEAESVIGGKLANADWTLTDPAGVTIDDDYTDARAVEAFDLLEKPQANLTVGSKLSRSRFLRLTSQLMGLTGNAFWFLDQTDALAGIPGAIINIVPWRMTPVEDSAGNLTGWLLDRNAQTGAKGIPLALAEVVHLKLNEPATGHFGTGLVESAFVKIQLSQSTDLAALSVMNSTGRLSGIMSPKAGGVIADDTQYEQLIRDWRNIVEQPDAAKRLQVVRAPVDFVSTVMTMDDMKVVDFMNGSRDFIFAIWQVPPSQAAGVVAAGLNSGDTKKYDEASLWQGPVHDRITEIEEKTQDQILDRWEPLLGWAPEYEIEEPTFDDDSPRYDLLAKSLNSPLMNWQRLALIGEPPTGDPNIDNQIMLPVTLVPYATVGTPSDTTTPTSEALGRTPVQVDAESATPKQPTSTDNPVAASMAGETSQGPKKAALKANRLHTSSLHHSLVALRTNMAKTITPRIERSIKDLLAEQKADIADKVRRNWEHIKTKHDADAWWAGAKWDKRLHDVLTGPLVGMAETVDTHISGIFHAEGAQKASPASAINRVLNKRASRITKINQTTQTAVEQAITKAIADNLTAQQAADLIEGIDVTLDDGTVLPGVAAFDDYRAEMIARTEMMDAYNSSALGAYEDADFAMVEALDGDQDEECADRLAGNPYSIDDADSQEDHPNGTLDWVPYLEEPIAVAKATVASKAQELVALVKADGEAKDERMTRVVESLAAMVTAMQAHPTQVDLHATVEAPVVNVPAPIVNVPAPIVNMPAAKAVIKTVERDAEGRITRVVES